MQLTYDRRWIFFSKVNNIINEQQFIKTDQKKKKKYGLLNKNKIKNKRTLICIPQAREKSHDSHTYVFFLQYLNKCY